MTWFKAGSAFGVIVFFLVLVTHNVLPAAFAYKDWGKDAFVGVQPQVSGEINQHLSKLNSRLAGCGHSCQVNNWRDKWALLVGVSRYQDSSIQPFRIARNDVQLISALLQEPAVGRFAPDHVAHLVGHNATRDAIQQAIFESSLIKKALPNDLIIVYLSARTIPLAGENDLCLCAYDTRSSEPGVSGVRLAETLSNLRKRTQCAQIVCILDCASVSKKEFEQSGVVSLEELSKKTGVSIISASDLNEDMPACLGGTISSFALHFADVLRNTSGTVSLSMIVNYVQDNLNKESQELGTASQTVSFIPAETTPKVRDIILGAPVRNGHRTIAIGHDVRTLALDRPDLLSDHRNAVSADKPNQSRTVNNGKTAEDDPEDARFTRVNFGPWMDKMKQDIRAKWQPPKGLEQRTVACLFTIKRDGSIVTPTIVESSGIEAVDQSALAALRAASPLDPLPAGAPPSVRLRYLFDWKGQHD